MGFLILLFFYLSPKRALALAPIEVLPNALKVERLRPEELQKQLCLQEAGVGRAKKKNQLRLLHLFL